MGKSTPRSSKSAAITLNVDLCEPDSRSTTLFSASGGPESGIAVHLPQHDLVYDALAKRLRVKTIEIFGKLWLILIALEKFRKIITAISYLVHNTIPNDDANFLLGSTGVKRRAA
jgi:hypothetical protein